MGSRAFRRGFTLIELLVVIALVATLAGMLFPVFARARKAAQGPVCLSNLMQIGQATMLYAADADERYPAAEDVSDVHTTCRPRVVTGLPLVQDALLPYTKSRAVWACPLDGGVPKLSPAEYEEPTECDLGGTASLYQAYGASYLYRSDLARDGAPVPATLHDPYHEGAEHGPSEVPVFYDAYGCWHGDREADARRDNAAFADGHANHLPTDCRRGVLGRAITVGSFS